jgi:hypothetical protein
MHSFEFVIGNRKRVELGFKKKFIMVALLIEAEV